MPAYDYTVAPDPCNAFGAEPSLGYSDPTAAPTSLGYSETGAGSIGYSEPPGARHAIGYSDELSASAPGGYSSELVAGPVDGGASAAGGPLKTKPLPREYAREQEDASNFRGNPGAWDRHASTPGTHFTGVKTRYLDDAEQARAAVSVEDGLLKTQDGAVDTLGNAGTGTQFGMGAGKNIFAMTPDGEIRTTAAWEGHTEDADPNGGPNDKTLSMLNHSSLAAVDDGHGGRKGGAAAGAGELTVDHGKLLQVSDQSGHYRPDNTMTSQVLGKLQDDGVDMHDVEVKLTPKSGPYDKDSQDPDKKYLHASARELMSYDGAADAEEKMRARRKAMKSEIEAAAAEREARGGGSAAAAQIFEGQY